MVVLEEEEDGVSNSEKKNSELKHWRQAHNRFFIVQHAHYLVWRQRGGSLVITHSLFVCIDLNDNVQVVPSSQSSKYLLISIFIDTHKTRLETGWLYTIESSRQHQHLLTHDGWYVSRLSNISVCRCRSPIHRFVLRTEKKIVSFNSQLYPSMAIQVESRHWPFIWKKNKTKKGTNDRGETEGKTHSFELDYF